VLKLSPKQKFGDVVRNGSFFILRFARLLPAVLQQCADRIYGLFPPALLLLLQEVKKFKEKPLHISPFLALNIVEPLRVQKTGRRPSARTAII
jgi:hypothetical protein